MPHILTRLCLNYFAFLKPFHSYFLTHVYPLYQRNSFTLKFSKQIHFNSCSLLLVQDVQHTCGFSAIKSLDVFLNISLTAAEIMLTVQYAINCQMCVCCTLCVLLLGECLLPFGPESFIFTFVSKT